MNTKDKKFITWFFINLIIGIAIALLLFKGCITLDPVGETPDDNIGFAYLALSIYIGYQYFIKQSRFVATSIYI